ncbi:uncharacterized protein B0I36DRAFT_345105 [Microdochium trichocladiopsis]|uniref:Uncharacterized protein n=1 Tax=Microdochium trichocladiopsis TaxID=1682393 RepID=A0A9P8YJE9_9PEZI|nr:uncharacterized protein B0I36DRAFT_345105 [Microdochium trichocladiopsis]KAH7041509.1 hypothetical protein B0I36DRAFT_345105 [Microdochium trichocladiopsis]
MAGHIQSKAAAPALCARSRLFSTALAVLTLLFHLHSTPHMSTSSHVPVRSGLASTGSLSLSLQHNRLGEIRAGQYNTTHPPTIVVLPDHSRRSDRVAHVSTTVSDELPSFRSGTPPSDSARPGGACVNQRGLHILPVSPVSPVRPSRRRLHLPSPPPDKPSPSVDELCPLCSRTQQATSCPIGGLG